MDITYVDKTGEHTLNINEFVKGKSFDYIMKIINRDEDELFKLKEHKRFKNDYAMYTLLKYYYNLYNDITNPSTLNKKCEDSVVDTRLIYNGSEFVSMDDMNKFENEMKM